MEIFIGQIQAQILPYTMDYIHFLANPSGRLIRYNAATKKNEVLVKNLGFANGVLLSDDESFVIVLECLTSRMIKYHLKGPKAGQHEIFAEALPGLPDNVHSDGQGGFLVSLIVSIDSEHPFSTSFSDATSIYKENVIQIVVFHRSSI